MDKFTLINESLFTLGEINDLLFFISESVDELDERNVVSDEDRNIFAHDSKRIIAPLNRSLLTLTLKLAEIEKNIANLPND